MIGEFSLFLSLGRVGVWGEVKRSGEADDEMMRLILEIGTRSIPFKRCRMGLETVHIGYREREALGSSTLPLITKGGLKVYITFLYKCTVVANVTIQRRLPRSLGHV